MPRLVRDAEMAAAAPTLAISEAATANETPPSPRVEESNNSTQSQEPVQTQLQQRPVTSKQPIEKVIIPPPPPNVPEIQLKMCYKTISVRTHQLKQLSPDHLSGLADELRKDFMTSRHGKNEYSAAMAHVLRKSRESGSGGSNGGDDTDLAAGRYSSLYLQQENSSPESIGRHFLALFYRSIDNRLAPAMNKHGLDALRKGFASLDKWRKKKLEDVTRERKRPLGEENDDVIDNDAKTARKGDETSAKSQEVALTEPAKMVSKQANGSSPAQPEMSAEPNVEQLDQQEGAVVADTSGNADVVMEDTSSLVQTALRKGFSAQFLRGKTNAQLLALLSPSSLEDKTTHHASSSEATGTTANVSAGLNFNSAAQPFPSHLSATKDTNGNTNVVMEDSSSLIQSALRKGFSAQFLRGKTNAELLALLSPSSVEDKTTHHASSSKATVTTANVSERLNSADVQFDASATEDTNAPAATNNKKAFDKEDTPNNDNEMFAVNKNPSQIEQIHHDNGVERGNTSNLDVGGSDNERMSGVSYESRGREENTTALPSTSNVGRPELRVNVEEDTSVAMSNPAPNNLGNKEPDADNEMSTVYQNPTQIAHQIAHIHLGNELETGNSTNHDVGGGENKKMHGVSSESRVREENASTLSSDGGRPELRVNVEDTTVAKSNLSAPNTFDKKNDKTNAANDSNIPAGYRRRTVKKCVILDCPNRGGKCSHHGSLARTCIFEGCENFQIQGFEVCIRHGARPTTRGSEENPTVLSSSDVGRPELCVSIYDTSLAKSNQSAPNNCESKDGDKTDAQNDSSIPAGYRRRTVRKCHIYDCPYKGGKCSLHGKLGKTCKVVGCQNFRVCGFELCVRHGATNPNKKGKQSIDRLPGEAANHSVAATMASAKPPLPANQYHASFADAPAESQMSATNESQAAAAREPLTTSLKRESSGGLHSSNFTDGTQVEINPTGFGEGKRGATQQNMNVDELIDLTEDSPVRKGPTEHLISSPPPSPPPTTIIRNPPPPTKPRPNHFTDFHRILFCPDVVTERGTMSGCVKNYARQEMLVQFDRGYHPDGSGGSMDNAQCNDVQKRLNTWDPYWKIIEELGRREISCGTGMTSVGSRTTACLPITNDPLSLGGKSIPTCGMVSIDFRQEISRSASASRDAKGRSVKNFRPWGVRWGWEKKPPDSYQLGDRRVIMRCIPLRRTAAEEKKRADLHIWPRGSFVQIKLGNGCDQVIPVIQRKQQSHDHSKWLGNSRHLDLTKYITDTNHPLDIKICSKEVIEGVLDGLTLRNSYAINVSVCEYTPPDDLYKQLMGKEDGEVLMPKLSLRSAKRMLKECIANNTISLESDEEEDDGKESESDFLTFSLSCHASMKCIETPVRGQSCTHLQCFDLRNYLYTNNVVSAGRWKCPYCENFVSVRDLVHCGLFQAILDDVADKIEPGVRDKVRVNADGTWQLLGENKLRYNKKSSSQADAAASEAVDIEVIGSEGEGDGPEEIEIDIIEIE